MSSSSPEARSFYERLLKQGFSREEIAQVHRRLREKGYGERLSEGVLQRELGSVRRDRVVERRERAASPEAAEQQAGRRAEDRFPAVSPALRRRINAYARSLRLPIVGAREWLDDVLSLLPFKVPDCIARSFVDRLTRQRGIEALEPGELSLYDTLQALSFAAQKLLGELLPPGGPPGGGGSGGRRVRAAQAGASDSENAKADLRRRDPFGYRVLQEFVSPYGEIKKHLEYLQLRYANGERIEAAALSEITRVTYRVCLKTERVDKQTIAHLLELTREIQGAYRRNEAYGAELDEAARIFRIARENLDRHKFELYPVMLRLLGTVHPWRPQDEAFNKRMRDCLGVADGEVLEYHSFHKQLEHAQAEQRRAVEQRELERLEREKSSRFRETYAPVLRLLGSLFPGSEIAQIDQGAFVLPYFERVLFRDSPRFVSVEYGLTSLSAEDPLAVIIPLHRVIDDWLHSLDPYRLERLLGDEAVSSALLMIREEWQAVYAELFDLYLRDIGAYAKEVSVSSERAREFLRSRSAYVLQRDIEALRTRLLRRGERSAAARDRSDRIVLPMLAERLHNELIAVGKQVSLATLRREDPAARRVIKSLTESPLVEYAGHAEPSSYEYKPATRQLKRYIEARKQQPIGEIGAYASLFPLDTLRSVADLYRFLLRDPSSFLMLAGSRVEIAGPFEHAAWEEAESESRDPGASLRIEFAEELSAQYLDQLTGLRNKNFYLERMPELFKRLRRDGKPITTVMLDIDHFKWINDTLGHQYGDRMLAAVGELIGTNTRPSDWAIRYGGEELLILIGDDLNAAVVVGERLRYQQQERVESASEYEPVRQIARENGEPCGTFSVGIAPVEDCPALEPALERADGVLYAAKRTRNLVMVLAEAGGAPLPYEQYRARLSAPPGVGAAEDTETNAEADNAEAGDAEPGGAEAGDAAGETPGAGDARVSSDAGNRPDDTGGGP